MLVESEIQEKQSKATNEKKLLLNKKEEPHRPNATGTDMW
jgi:hypothetical protein